MTIKTITTCDKCEQEIKGNAAFTITSQITDDLKLRMDFCSYDCMRIYFMSKWNEVVLANE